MEMIRSRSLKRSPKDSERRGRKKTSPRIRKDEVGRKIAQGFGKTRKEENSLRIRKDEVGRKIAQGFGKTR